MDTDLKPDPESENATFFNRCRAQQGKLSSALYTNRNQQNCRIRKWTLKKNHSGSTTLTIQGPYFMRNADKKIFTPEINGWVPFFVADLFPCQMAPVVAFACLLLADL
jgi:hypothetical protein